MLPLQCQCPARGLQGEERASSTRARPANRPNHLTRSRMWAQWAHGNGPVARRMVTHIGMHFTNMQQAHTCPHVVVKAHALGGTRLYQKVRCNHTRAKAKWLGVGGDQVVSVRFPGDPERRQHSSRLAPTKTPKG